MDKPKPCDMETRKPYPDGRDDVARMYCYTHKVGFETPLQVIYCPAAEANMDQRCQCAADWTDGTGTCEECGKVRVMVYG